MASHPVTVSLQALAEGSVPSSSLDEAFGPESLGIIIVKDLPPQFLELRVKVLSYSSYLANLPEDELAKLEAPSAEYFVGWSLGKETLKPGIPDTLKGSYYINCAFYTDPSLDCAPTTSPSGQKDYTSFTGYTAPNKWPAEDVLPGFRAASEDLCRLIIDTATLVARACDTFAEKNVEGYENGYLERMVRSSVTTKARLLHYFPAKGSANGTDERTNGANGERKDEEENEDDWCATHIDHSCLTGLTSAMYVDESAHDPSSTLSTSNTTRGELPILPELPNPPDPETGLYIHARSGAITKVNIPKDCLAFQTGEALERITQQRFRAVPHFVKGASGTRAKKVDGGSGNVKGGSTRAKIARNTLAIFTQPNLWEVVDLEGGKDFAEFAREVAGRHS